MQGLKKIGLMGRMVIGLSPFLFSACEGMGFNNSPSSSVNYTQYNQMDDSDGGKKVKHEAKARKTSSSSSSMVEPSVPTAVAPTKPAATATVPLDAPVVPMAPVVH